MTPIAEAEIPLSSLDPPHSPAQPLPRRYFLASLAAVLFFAAWSFFVGRVAVPALDQACAEKGAELCQVHPATRTLMVNLTDFGSIGYMATLAITGAVWQFALKRRFLALAWVGIVLGGGLIDLGLKSVFDRPRPPVELRDRAVHEENASYPSGHSMGSTIGYGMLGYALILTQPSRRRRMVTVMLLATVVVAIGCSRIVLRAHWLSDVVAGWTMGMAWLCFCLGLIEWRRPGLSAQQDLEGPRTQ